METKERRKVIYTGSIPQCPFCEMPTVRDCGFTSSTGLYYTPLYDENGNNVNPDGNIHTSSWTCHKCRKDYTIAGNDLDGYYYSL